MRYRYRLFPLALAALLALTFATGSALAEEEKLFGGNGDDIATGFIPLSDGGYLVYGVTDSTDGPFRRSEGMGGPRVPWAMRLDRGLEVIWHFLMPNAEESLGAVKHAAELENGQIALLIERIDDEDASELVLLGKGRDILRQETLDLSEGKISAVPGGAAACGRGMLEDSGDPCLTVVHLFFDQDELDYFDDNAFEVLRCTAAFTKGEALWMLADVKLPDSKQLASVAFCLTPSETGRNLFRNHWAHKDQSHNLPSLGMLPDEEGVFVSLQLPSINATDKTKPAWHWMNNDDGRIKTCLVYTPGQLMAMPYADANGSFAIVGYKGSEGDRHAYAPRLGDTGFAHYQNQVTGGMHTLTKSHQDGGIRFVDGIWEGKVMRILCNLRTRDKKCQVLMDEWNTFENDRRTP